VKVKKKQNEELLKSQQWAKKIYDVLYKEPFYHIMSKARKTLGTALHTFSLLSFESGFFAAEIHTVLQCN